MIKQTSFVRFLRKRACRKNRLAVYIFVEFRKIMTRSSQRDYTMARLEGQSETKHNPQAGDQKTGVANLDPFLTGELLRAAAMSYERAQYIPGVNAIQELAKDLIQTAIDHPLSTAESLASRFVPEIGPAMPILHASSDNPAIKVMAELLYSGIEARVEGALPAASQFMSRQAELFKRDWAAMKGAANRVPDLIQAFDSKELSFYQRQLLHGLAGVALPFVVGKISNAASGPVGELTQAAKNGISSMAKGISNVNPALINEEMALATAGGGAMPVSAAMAEAKDGNSYMSAVAPAKIPPGKWTLNQLKELNGLEPREQPKQKRTPAAPTPEMLVKPGSVKEIKIETQSRKFWDEIKNMSAYKRGLYGPIVVNADETQYWSGSQWRHFGEEFEGKPHVFASANGLSQRLNEAPGSKVMIWAHPEVNGNVPSKFLHISREVRGGLMSPR